MRDHDLTRLYFVWVKPMQRGRDHVSASQGGDLADYIFYIKLN